jgi:putative transposase
MPAPYRSYHSGLKLQFADGKMQPDVTRTIPRSTKQRWKGKSIGSFWTPYPISDTLSNDYLLQRLKKENAKLKVQVRSLFYLVAIYRELVALSPFITVQIQSGTDSQKKYRQAVALL